MTGGPSSTLADGVAFLMTATWVGLEIRALARRGQASVQLAEETAG